MRQAARATTFVVLLGASGTLAYSALAKDVTLVVDGRPEVVRTMSANVAGLLASEGIVLTDGTYVAPPVSAPLFDGMTVFVDFPRALAATWRPDVGVWVMEGTSGLHRKVAVRLVEANASAPGVGTSPVVAVEAVVLGKVHGVLTNASTVGELLSAMGITPDASDRVRPSPSTPLHDGIRVAYDEIRVAMRDRQVTVPPPVVNRLSEDLAPGEVRIVRRGSEGLVLESYRVRIVNGEVARRVLLSRITLMEPVSRIRLVGPSATGGTQSGEASWYDAPGTGFTAAHPWLPYGTIVRVTYLSTGESITVTIDDRGPFGGRIIDLSPEAFSALAPLSQGVMQVRLTW
jgi:uncharacterized protein YabE (DUF348 family)